jgi:hypothetical protein
MSDDRYRGADEVADLFGIPVEAIRRRAGRGEIQHTRIGRNYIRFSPEDIAAIREQFKVEASSPSPKTSRKPRRGRRLELVIRPPHAARRTTA